MEEDIKILEERITMLKRHIKYYEESDCKTDIYYQLIKECKALENLLTRYKEQKERIRNLELKIVNQKEQIKLLRTHRLRKYVMSEYIEKSKIKETIEELEKQIDDLVQNGDIYNDNVAKYNDLKLKIETLQELLEEE